MNAFPRFFTFYFSPNYDAKFPYANSQPESRREPRSEKACLFALIVLRKQILSTKRNILIVIFSGPSPEGSAGQSGS